MSRHVGVARVLAAALMALSVAGCDIAFGDVTTEEFELKQMKRPGANPQAVQAVPAAVAENDHGGQC
ncbi:MAG: hypothetical protein ACOY5U_10990 [Pseudomonadota bacterium]